MPETQIVAPRPEASAALPPPSFPPLLRVLVPLAVAAIVVGFLFTRYLSALAPSTTAPAIRFTDVTAESGVNFVHEAGATPGNPPPTTLGSGVAVIDYDGDGAPDLFFVNGAPWPWIESTTERPPHCMLFHNDGHGHFTDVTDRAGVGLMLLGMGVAVGDYDNDGHPDLYVTAVGRNHLLHNRGDGTFEDVSEEAGVAGDDHIWSTGALWLDLDGDGKLDLVVCRYARWPREVELDLAFKIAGVGRSYGAPAGFVSVSPVVYRNLGDGHFADVTEAMGLSNRAPDTGLSRPEPLVVTALDSNDDGRLDLLFLYHAGEPTLYLNEGHGKFREWVPPIDRREGAAGLVALNGLPLHHAWGPVDVADVLRTIDKPMPGGTWLRLPTRLGLAFLDYDLDGHVDIFSTAGRAEPEMNRFDEGRNFETAPRFWWNRGDAWVLASPPADSEWTAPILGRGVASADFDGDGDLDLVVTQNGGPAKLFRNDQRIGSAWLRIQLVGTTSPRDGTGARVEVHTPRHTLVALATPAMGYLSQSESVLTFGLGDDARVRRITVVWPSGLRQDVVPSGINRKMVIVEGR